MPTTTVNITLDEVDFIHPTTDMELTNVTQTIATQDVPTSGAKVVDSGITYKAVVQDASNLGGVFNASLSAVSATFEGTVIEANSANCSMKHLSSGGGVTSSIVLENGKVRLRTPAVIASTATVGAIPKLSNVDGTIEFVNRKIWKGVLSQTGTNAPTVEGVNENDLGGTIVWTYDIAGKFIGTLSGAFGSNQYDLNAQINVGVPNGLASIVWANSNQINIFTNDYSGGAANDILDFSQISIEIFS